MNKTIKAAVEEINVALATIQEVSGDIQEYTNKSFDGSHYNFLMQKTYQTFRQVDAINTILEKIIKETKS